MDPTWRDIEDGDEDDEENQQEGVQPFRDGLIFLIDTTSGMFGEEKENEDKTPFQTCLMCARATLSNRIVSNDRDLISVIFFGTDKKKNSSDFEHIYVFQDLEQPNADRIMAIEKQIDGSKKDFEKEFGHNNNFSLSDALWTCSSVFSNCSARLGTKRIFLFTNTDHPHESSTQLTLQAKAKAKDLNDLNITVELMPLKKQGKELDVQKFYRDIIFLEDIEKAPSSTAKFEQLMNRVRSKAYKKRSMGHLRWSLGEGVALAVSLYNLICLQRKPFPVKLEKKNNAELKSMTRKFLADTAEILLPADMKKYQEFAHKKIYMEMDELTEIKKFDEPGILLLGFKPVSSLKRHLHVRSSHFIYPDEWTMPGSTTLFAALLSRCAHRGKAPICRFIGRRSDAPKFVALLPQLEEHNAEGVQVAPPGFHVVQLPFAEDLRNLGLRQRQNPTAEMVDSAKDVVKALAMDYKPDSIQNPVLQQHWRNIEALALNRDEPDPMEDHTMPNWDAIKKKAGPTVDKFKELIFPDGYENIDTKKRKPAPVAANTPGGKKAKSDAPVTVDIKHEAEEGRLDKLTVNVLKQFCKSMNIKSGTKKKDIIDAINEFLGL